MPDMVQAYAAGYAAHPGRAKQESSDSVPGCFSAMGYGYLVLEFDGGWEEGFRQVGCPSLLHNWFSRQQEYVSRDVCASLICTVKNVCAFGPSACGSLLRL